MTSPTRRYATPPTASRGPLPLMRPRVATGWGKSHPSYALVSLLCLLLVGCREPMSVERFVGGEGPYTFFVEMGDSTASYDFDFYTRVDAPLDSLVRMGALPLTVTWTSPSFHVFREDVYMPMEGRTSYFSREVMVPYRAGVRPEEWGQWTLTVRPVDPPEGLRGMGLIVRRNKEEFLDGTR